MPRKLKGIRRHGNKGWQAYVTVHGHRFYAQFPLDTPPATMLAWQARERALHKDDVAAAPTAGSFGADIAAYLRRVAAMPTLAERAMQLELWAQALGRDRPRSTITPGEIDAVMQGWLRTPTRPDYAAGARGCPSRSDVGLDPQTVRKRRTALQSFFVKLNGKAGANPVRGAQAFRPPPPRVRGTDYDTIRRIHAAMPTWRSCRRGAVAELSLAKVVVGVLGYTGLPIGLVYDLKPDDVRLLDERPTVRVGRRRKGAGVESRVLPLSPDAIEAFRAFHAANAYGRFNIRTVNQSFKRTAKRLGIVGLTVLDLRHSFGAQVYRVTRDTATVGRLMMHAAGSTMPARYAAAANADVNTAAIAAFGASVAPRSAFDHVSPAVASAQPGQVQLSVQKSAKKSATPRKRLTA